MKSAFPRPRPAHLAETPTSMDYWDAEIDARLAGEQLVQHGRRCSCPTVCVAVAR